MRQYSALLFFIIFLSSITACSRLDFTDEGPVPAQPQAPRVLPSDSALTVYITEVPGADALELCFRRDQDSAPEECLRLSSPVPESVLLDRLINGERYSVRVRGVNRYGAGPFSEAVVGIPVLPSDNLESPVITLTPGVKSLTAIWQAIPDAMAYEVFCATIDSPSAYARVGSATTATTLQLQRLTAGIPWFVKIRAASGTAVSAFSPVQSAVPLAGTDTPALSESLSPATASTGARFAASVAMNGTIAAIGAPGEYAGTGAVHLASRNAGGAWTVTERIAPPADSGAMGFGAACALSDTVLVIGAPDAAAGAVFVYMRNSAGTWRLLFSAQGEQDGERFGAAVTTVGSRILVGSPSDDLNSDEPAADFGSATLLEFNNAGEITSRAHLTSPEKERSERFGSAIWLTSTHAFIGAPGNNGRNDVPVSASGAVFALTLAAPETARMITPSDPVIGGAFGGALSACGDLIAVGAEQATHSNDEPITAGGVYLFQRSGDAFSLQQKLVSPSPVGFGRFGWSVALTGRLLVIGAPDEYQAGIRTGNTHIFSVSDGSLILTATASEYNTGARFGAAVAAWMDRVIAGAPDQAAESGDDVSAGRASVIE